MRPYFLLLFSVFFCQHIEAQKKAKPTKIVKSVSNAASDSTKPRFNNASAYNTKPRAPFLLKLAVTNAQAPVRFRVKGIPLGLYIDTVNGIISGEIAKTGKFKMLVTAKAKNGLSTKEITIQSGDTMRTPPTLIVHLADENVTDSLLRDQVKKMVDRNVFNYGWQYVTIGNVWQDSVRNANGNLFSNAKFPDMQDMILWLHEQGIKFGLTSTSDSSKNATIMSSYGYERQDAATFSRWGVDLVNYEYKRMNDSLAKLDSSKPADQKMHSILNNQQRLMPMMSFASTVARNDSVYPPIETLNLNLFYSALVKQCLSNEPMIVNYNTNTENIITQFLLNESFIAIHQDPLMLESKVIIQTENYEVRVKKCLNGKLAFAMFNTTDNDIVGVKLSAADLQVKPNQIMSKVFMKSNNSAPIGEYMLVSLPGRGVLFATIQ